MGVTKYTTSSFKGMNQDISKEKFPEEYYYEAHNISLNPNTKQLHGALTNKKGNALSFRFPTIQINKGASKIVYGTKELNYTNVEINSMPTTSGKQQYLGHVNTKEGCLIFTTDDAGFDCIWEIPNLEAGSLDYDLLYVRNMGLSTSKPIQALFNYENELIQKVYWVDGKNYLRYFNKNQWVANGFDSDLIDNNLSTINSRGEFNLKKPKVSRSYGGNHTAGVIQYAYTLYNVNSSETALSPVSELFPLDKGPGKGGGATNENVGAMPIITIENLDTEYSYIKLYSIKYTILNGTPEVKLIYDSKIGNYNKFTFNDTGNYNLGVLSIPELAFLGADPIIPKHIAIKDSVLFASNNKVTAYELDVDTRAYSYNADRTSAKIYDNVTYTGVGEIPYTGTLLDAAKSLEIPKDFDCVNLDYDTFRYKSTGQVSTNVPIVTNANYYSLLINDIAVSNGILSEQATITPVNGETTIINNKIYPSYDGTIELKINSVVNLQGSLAVADEDNKYFSLEVYKNDVLFRSFIPNIVNTGLNQNVFTVNINVKGNDRITIVAHYHNPNGSGKNFNVAFYGTTTAKGITAAGSNLEGGSGKFIEYELTRTASNLVDVSIDKFLKDNEIYRIAGVFYNSKGQHTEAKWIADFKAPQGNLEGQFNTLRVSLTDAFYEYIATLPEEDRPVSFSVVRAIRRESDKTISTQGMLSGMFVQLYDKDDDKYGNAAERAEFNSELVKMPIPTMRGYGVSVDKTKSYFPLYSTMHCETMTNKSTNRTGTDARSADSDNPNGYKWREIYNATPAAYKVQQSWQYTKLFQMHSPELVFNSSIATTDADELVVLGTMKRKDFSVWEQPYNVETFLAQNERGSREDFLNGAVGTFENSFNSGYGLIGPPYRNWDSGGAEDYNMMRRYNIYKNYFPIVRKEKRYEIYGAPEITDVGQPGTFYNKDKSLQYINKLTPVSSDTAIDDNENRTPRKMKSVLSEGTRCMTIALGDDTLTAEQRPSLESLYADTNTSDWDVELIAEIRKPKSYIYSGAIYNGYTVEAKNRTEYIQIGDVIEVEDRVVDITSPGDTFVQSFVCPRLVKTPGSAAALDVNVLCDTIEFTVETTINTMARSDKSVQGWDFDIAPTAEEAADYNTVYSTDMQVITFSGDDDRIRKVAQKETEIIGSKVKIPGEFVESWVDFKPNDVMYLDGRYGPINNILTNRDILYAIQDRAVAVIGVNPRVQVQGNDNISIELGTGNLLHDYRYLSTDSGSINKWSILPTPTGLYYVDLNNKMIMLATDKVESISETFGMHTTLVNKLNRENLRLDNPLLGTGINTGLDIISGEVFFTFLQEEGFTLGFNTRTPSFSSFYDFKPVGYISKGDLMYMIPEKDNASAASLWKYNYGKFQTYFNLKYSSKITLLVKGEPALEKVFNNIQFDAETFLNGQDAPNVIFDGIRAWNSYQDTGNINLVVNKNLKRRFRTWRADIGRQKDTRNRMRDKWIFIELEFKPTNDYELIVHDIIIKYT